MTTKSNIVLVGFMGTGKSSVAKILAKATGRTMVEMDSEIEKSEGMPITDIFAQRGEPYFRQRERAMVQKLSGEENLVISTGGGVVLNEDNVKDFKRNGVVVCLSASAETIYARVKNRTHRPLLHTEDPFTKIQEMLAARAPLYAQADATVQTDGKTVQEVSEEVERIITHEKS